MSRALRVRVIPILQLQGSALVKTTKFARPVYIGDPANTVRIFNELEVDELAFVDIAASRQSRPPDWHSLRVVAEECFMPLAYGGGIADIATAEKLFQLGFEKLILNTSTFTKPELITQIAKRFGSQAVIAAVDVRTNWRGRYVVTSLSGTVVSRIDPVSWAVRMEGDGAGEILLTSIEREGTWSGFDVILTEKVASAVQIPVVAHGGGGLLEHIRDVVKNGGASAAALGSMVVYQAKGFGVLVNFPERVLLDRLFD